MNRAYALGAVVLTAAVLIFAMQNLQLTTIEFFIWEFDTPASLVALVPFLAGIVIGWLSGRFRQRRKAKDRAAIPSAAAPALGAGAPHGAAAPDAPETPVEETAHQERA